MALFSKFFGNTVGQGAAFAIGATTARTLDPILQEVANAAWSHHPDKPVEPELLAQGVSQGQVPYGWAVDEAARTGINKERFDHMVSIANVGPGVSAAFELWRRDLIAEDDFRRALKRIGLEQEWINDLVKLKGELLTPGEISAAIHRGLIPDPGLLKGEQPQPPFNVEPYPVYPIPALAEAAGHGYDHDRLGVLVGLQGLPMGPHEAAQALFRGIITRGDYIRAFNESNNRNEWAEAVLEQSRQIPTARDFFENALRGYHPFEWALEQAKRHGMSEDDATVIYQNQGRPMNVHAITQALARGGKFHPEPGELTDPYDAAIVEGNLKPAYYDLAKALKYVMPSAFAIRQLVQSGVWSAEKAAERLKWAGWYPPDADEVAAAWAKGTGSGPDSHVGKAETTLWNNLQRSYLAGETTQAQARDKMNTLSIPTGAQTTILHLWDETRELIRKQLTPAQVKKAYTKAVQNPATGLPWTLEDATAELLQRGYSMTDAQTFLAE